MYRVGPSPISPLTHRTVLILATISLLTMPVNYKGGAEETHPHGVFQLWEDLSHGSIDHHHAGHESGRRHDESATRSAPAVAETAQADPDLPRLMDGTGPAPERPVAIVFGAAEGFLVVVRSPRLVTTPARPAGRSLKPALPPPRLALAD